MLTLLQIGAGASVAAFVISRIEAGGLTRLLIAAATFCAVALLVHGAQRAWLHGHYRYAKQHTTVELFGGHSLTLVIHHTGLPVKVRARAVFAEFGNDMEQHPAPFDLMLFTRTHGGRYESIELNPTFDMAKSLFGELRALDKDAAEFSVDRPGLTNFTVVVQRSAVLAYLNITVKVIEPTHHVPANR